MTELLSAFSLGQLVLFVVLLAVAIKEVSTFIDWARSKIEKRDNKHQEKIDRDQKIDNQLIEFKKELKYIT